MNNLIEVTNNDGKQAVSARDLYLGLGLDKSNWSRWSKSNIERNNFFVENIDWVKQVIEIQGTQTTEYNLSQDFVYHLVNSAKTVSSSIKHKVLKKLGLKKRIDLISRKEIEFLDMLEKVLEPFDYTLLKQYSALNYRIDLYIEELNVAIEYDENGHQGYYYKEEKGRQKEIEKHLKCRFIRLEDNKSNLYNIGLVVKELFQ